MYSFISDVFVDHVSCSHRTNTTSFKNFLEHNFVTVKSEQEKQELGDSDDEKPMTIPDTYDTQNVKDESDSEKSSEKEKIVEKPAVVKKKRSIVFRPFYEAQKLLIYIEDIHMSSYD